MANDNNNNNDYDAENDNQYVQNGDESYSDQSGSSTSHFFTNMIDPLQFSTFLLVLLLLFVFYLLLPRGIRKQYFYAHPKRHAWTARSQHSNGSHGSHMSNSNNQNAASRSLHPPHTQQQQQQQQYRGNHASTPIGLQVRSFGLF